MDGKKQFWKGLAAGFVITLVLIEAVTFGGKALDRMKSSTADSPQADLTNDTVEKKLEEILQEHLIVTSMLLSIMDIALFYLRLQEK